MGTFTRRPSLPTVSLVSTVASVPPSSALSSTEVSTSVSTTLLSLSSLSVPSSLPSFALGWGVTTAAGIASSPLDTIRRRMMMTSGEKVHYKSMADAARQIIAAEGVKSLFHGVAGAGVLSLYDQVQAMIAGSK